MHEKTEQSIERTTVLKVLIGLFVLTFLLRIFYASYLYDDDGLWFTVGEELVRGKALYRKIYFDKPPGLALTYALLFSIFSWKLMNWMPSDRNSSSAERRCLVERANLSKRQHTTASNWRFRASSINILSSGRESFAPD